MTSNRGLGIGLHSYRDSPRFVFFLAVRDGITDGPVEAEVAQRLPGLWFGGGKRCQDMHAAFSLPSHKAATRGLKKAREADANAAIQEAIAIDEDGNTSLKDSPPTNAPEPGPTPVIATPPPQPTLTQPSPRPSTPPPSATIPAPALSLSLKIVYAKDNKDAKE
ncbi:hypothetical protein NEUTE1DRAFT_113844 [Neurospora tetrasperma FGSC 2508]|uniref:Uncharacterized protein n=1 Tax=Neurospora tetrasperma (strain FGSC 2508 / ATCC MYA-4615 / P0657) TaxID=510951 RepID=F8N3W0_NEUT8|nr:uncharacterized protein NEUTE1DRAFT_113844 [Neurospora tetrasperma FGSC 2508]EGO51810.1 hypothetical protein NEUTE1DRAFT_113844 [Neurospora tetrasperma FGSC 2508]